MQILPLGPLVSRLTTAARVKFDRWLKPTEEGREQEDLRSQLYWDSTRDEAIDDLRDRTEHWSADEGEFYDALRSFEEKEEARIGPFSVQHPYADRRESVAAYFSAAELHAQQTLLDRSFDRLRALGRRGRMQPWDLGRVRDKMPKGTYSGLPYLESDPSVLGYYFERARAVLGGDTGIEMEPSMLGSRATPRGRALKDVQNRVVFMYDKLDAILGGMYTQGILEVLKQYGLFAAYGQPDAVTKVITAYFKEYGRSLTVNSTDYSAYDTTAHVDLILGVLDCYASWFAQTPAFDFVMQAFVSSGLVTPEGIWVGRAGAIPSGGNWTSVLGSGLNFVASDYVARALRVNHVFGTYLGDDAVNVYDPSPPQDEISDAVGELGLEMNEDKQYVDASSAHYLQNIHHMDYTVEGQVVPVRPMYRFLSGALSYERRRDESSGWNRAMASARTIMQLENCRFHPDFASIVKFCVDGDDMLRHKDPVHIFKMAGGAHRVDKVLGYGRYHVTEGVGASSLDQFATVKELRRLATL